MIIRVIICVVSAVSSLTCASRFDLDTPAGSNAIGDRMMAAVAGVEVITDTDEWRGISPMLPALVPLQVTIENESRRPLRVRYQEFALLTSSGERLAALPPFDLKETVTSVPSFYPYPWNGFHVAPHISRFYRGFWTGSWDFAHDPNYYAMHYSTLTGLMAPTPEMIRQALPEGVLEPGGRITGFLYFHAPDATQATFFADLVDADSHEKFASVRVSVLVEGG